MSYSLIEGEIQCLDCFLKKIGAVNTTSPNFDLKTFKIVDTEC